MLALGRLSRVKILGLWQCFWKWEVWPLSSDLNSNCAPRRHALAGYHPVWVLYSEPTNNSTPGSSATWQIQHERSAKTPMSELFFPVQIPLLTSKPAPTLLV